VGTSVELPAGAAPPFRVFVNGVEQDAGRDYEVLEGAIVFCSPIWKEQKLSRWRFAGLALVGRYERHETVDLEYSLDGSRRFSSDLPVRAQPRE
jgi:hypothetical protein